MRKLGLVGGDARSWLPNYVQYRYISNMHRADEPEELAVASHSCVAGHGLYELGI